MKISILTIFPEMFAPLKESIIKRATQSGVLEINILNIRDYTLDRHLKTDDTPYGGGSGMVMYAQPIVDATNAADPEHKAKRIYMSPRGRVFTSSVAKELSMETELVLLCGHYEGVDERALTVCGYSELSIGDYVLTGGEIPAMAVVDSLSRFIPGVLGSISSVMDESFSHGLLEYPQYTKPKEIYGLSVPEVLLSGHHVKIDNWRREQSLLITEKNRPDLIKKLKEDL